MLFSFLERQNKRRLGLFQMDWVERMRKSSFCQTASSPSLVPYSGSPSTPSTASS